MKRIRLVGVIHLLVALLPPWFPSHAAEPITVASYYFGNYHPGDRRSATVWPDGMTTLAAVQMGSVPTEYAVGWFTLALINAGLAQGKGRSGLA